MKKGGILELLCIFWCFLLVPSCIFEGTTVGLVLIIIEGGLFAAWLVWALANCFIVIFRDTTLTELWEGFLNYLAETWEIIKFCLLIGIPLLVISVGMYWRRDY